MIRSLGNRIFQLWDSRLLVLEESSADRIGLAEGDGRSLCIALDEESDEENNRDEETENDREERRERHVQPQKSMLCKVLVLQGRLSVV